MLSLKQTARIISTYASDTSGVCSALYELSGMTVMHDASGCNSTYNTHDEPRWYDMDSLVFISALTEKDAIMGAETKLISDTVSAARELNPRFIALCGTPIPMMTGCDFDAVAYEVEGKTGIACFGFDTDGMHTYVSGASRAFAAFAEDERICPECEKSQNKSGRISVNLLGITPLDFSVNGQHTSMKEFFVQNGIDVNCVWAMGCTLEDIGKSAIADVNVVVSGCGLECARVLKRRFGTPYIIGTPYGGFAEKILQAVKDIHGGKEAKADGLFEVSDKAKVVIIGEGITGASLASALYLQSGIYARVICATDIDAELLRSGLCYAPDEDDILPLLEGAQTVIADPLYEPICPKGVRFIPLAHEGFSGRIYRDTIPDLIKNFDEFTKENNL